MNPQTIELIFTLARVARLAFEQLQAVLEREKSGVPLTDEELILLQSDSDAAHEVIQGWKPAGPLPP